MINNLQNEMAAILQKAQRQIIYKAIDAIQARNETIMNLLRNGQGIYEQAPCDRFMRIYEQRRKLLLKTFENDKTIGILFDTLENECVKY